MILRLFMITTLILSYTPLFMFAHFIAALVSHLYFSIPQAFHCIYFQFPITPVFFIHFLHYSIYLLCLIWFSFHFRILKKQIKFTWNHLLSYSYIHFLVGNVFLLIFLEFSHLAYFQVFKLIHLMFANSTHIVNQDFSILK